jgi:hypothetical protein
MKNVVKHGVVQIEKAELQRLCCEVKETLATDVVFSQEKKTSFGVADLWKVRRAVKVAGRLSNTRRGIQPVV